MFTLLFEYQAGARLPHGCIGAKAAPRNFWQAQKARKKSGSTLGQGWLEVGKKAEWLRTAF
jgi:hypothetical protein